MESDEQALVPAEPKTVPVFWTRGQAVEIDGLEGFTPADLNIAPPRIRIVHKKERREQVGEPGQFRIGDQAYDSLDVVFLRAHPLRVYIEGENKEARVICASTDGNKESARPDESVPYPKATLCARCEYSRWTDNPLTKKRVPPPCQAQVAMLAVIPSDNDRPAWFIASKTAARPAMAFLHDVAQGSIEGRNPGGLCSLVVHMTTEEQVNGGLVWYTPIFTVSGLVEGDRYRPLFTEVRNAGMRYLPRISAPADMAEDGEAEAGPVKRVLPPDDGSDEDIPF